jgi:hypothetical protein
VEAVVVATVDLLMTMTTVIIDALEAAAAVPEAAQVLTEVMVLPLTVELAAALVQVEALEVQFIPTVAVFNTQ